MAFPVSPTNGQQANINGITYTYSNVLTAWTVSTSVSNTFVSINVSANVNSGNVLNSGIISSTGNVAGNFFIGNGSALTGIAASYGNANVVANLAALGSNPVSTTGNVNGGNLLTAGLISATGNITGNYILGNGALLSGVSTSSSNINLGTSNITVVSSGGNITTSVGGTSNVVVYATTGEYITGVVSASGNVTGGNVITGGTISATGNLTAGNIATGTVTPTGTIVPRVVVIANGTSVTMNGDTTDMATQTNTQVAGTLTINAVTGTPINGQKLTFRLQSSNVQTFSWNAVFAGSSDLALPTASSGSSKYDYMGFVYNSTALKWQLLGKTFGF